MNVSAEQRASIKGQKPCVIWFTGLSGAGKTTIATALEQELHESGLHTFCLDGDNVRLGLNSDLGFSPADRVENIRRIGEVCKLFTDAGLIVIAAFISPFAEDRDFLRGLFEPGQFIEAFVSTPLAVCEMRDPKGLYAKARRGHLNDFTGLDSPYDTPTDPELILDASILSVSDCVDRVLELLQFKAINSSRPVANDVLVSE